MRVRQRQVTMGREWLWRCVLALGLALGTALALPGCAAVGWSSASAVTALGLLARAQAAAPRDAEFTVTLTIMGTGTPGMALTESGTGRLTTNPYRQDITIAGTVDGVRIALEAITDGQRLFTRSPDASTWHEAPADAASRFLSYRLSAPVLVGQETIGGVATWHLRGALLPDAPGDREDLWLRADNLFPARSEVHAVGAGGVSVAATLVYTGWNSGATITLPATGTPPAG